MPNDPLDPSETSRALLDVCQTISGLTPRIDDLAAKLQFVEDLLADAPALPTGPALLWRAPDRNVHCREIGRELIVGRQLPLPGLEIPHDSLLSRLHFTIRISEAGAVIEDGASHNGVAVNRPDNRVLSYCLRDGDVILAGSHAFVFLEGRG